MNNILKVSVKDIPEVVEAMEKASKEIERLQKDLTYYQEYSADLLNKNNTFENIIKEAREYIEENRVKATKYFNAFDGSLCMDKKYVDKLLEILDKGE